jgi:hypothetical protein
MVRSSRTGESGVFVVLAVVLFVVSILAAAGAYFYRTSLIEQKAKYEADLERSKDAFEPTLLTELERFDTRINTANELMARHITVLPLLNFLGQETLKTIRYRTFNLNIPADGTKSEVRLTGEAQGYESIALQSDVFAQTKKLNSFVFGNMNLDAAGKVNFDLSGFVDPSLLNYASMIKQ